MGEVSVVIPTRGDVDLSPVLASFPPDWETVVWDNSGQIRINGERLWGVTAGDISVYGRYAAIEYAKNPIIFTQDDDVIVSDPQQIVDVFLAEFCSDFGPDAWDGIVANMPSEFRHSFYVDHSLVGFGAAFHRDAPKRAFRRVLNRGPVTEGLSSGEPELTPFFRRTCDIVFTGLTPCVRVDVPHTDREMASDPNRMWKQPEHVAERTRMLELVRQVRTAGGIG